MKYNPLIHHRRSIRLKGYDYSQRGAYFITLNCQNRLRRFGEVRNGLMCLNELGTIAHEEWINLAAQFPQCHPDEFQIMPDHMHGIIFLDDVGVTLAVTQEPPVTGGSSEDLDAEEIIRIHSGELLSGQGAPKGHIGHGRPQGIAQTSSLSEAGNKTLGNIIGAYKSIVFNKCLEIFKARYEIMGKLWHRNYYEHIIRDARAYVNIHNYIVNNPRNWDKKHPENKL